MQTIALILYYLVAKDHSRCSRIFFCHSSTIESAIPRNSNILSQLFHENQADNAGKPLNLYGGSYPVLKNKKLLCIRCFFGHFPRKCYLRTVAVLGDFRSEGLCGCDRRSVDSL